MPESTRTACFALATGGFLSTVVTGIGLYLISTESVGALGKGLVGYWGCAAIGGYLSAVLVSQRVPLAIVPAMLVSLVYLLFFPLGTIVALIAFTKLSTEESRQYLAGDAQSR